MVFDCAISLGPSCRTGHQVRRVFGSAICISSIFDSQITPIETVRAYFASDFRGFFELADLYTGSDGIVRNRRWGTEHPHEFKRGLAAGYRLARERHDRRCANVMRAMSGRPILVAAGGDQNIWQAITNASVVVVNDRSAGDWTGDNETWDRALSGLSFSLRGHLLGYARKVRRRFDKAKEDVVIGIEDMLPFLLSTRA